ncbi:MAG: hypothetical protein SF066_06890 [Thermoanaerobaculia bacterium]|nr:hypothetical protein [Thermoanaerobaculia bacterium]
MSFAAPASLRLSHPGDPAEREAERVAEAVVQRSPVSRPPAVSAVSSPTPGRGFERAYFEPHFAKSTAITQSMPPGTIAGDWIIDNPARKFPSNTSPEDGALIEGAFQQISGLASRSGNRIVLGTGPPNPSQAEGHACLQDIENDLASPNPVLSGTPHVALEPHGWSLTNTAPPLVSARHPASSFEWGYWTGGQTRHLKPFWQTMAHEVCGHMAAHVRTRGANTGVRGVGLGHNIAIEGENRIATEHGVPAAELRGLDFDPATQSPLAGHRGESFLQSSITNFGHAATNLPASSTAVLREAVRTIQTVAQTHLDLFLQVEGFAFANEGGLPMAVRRAAAVRAALIVAITTAGIRAQIGSGATATSRFHPDLARVESGTSQAGRNNPRRRVQIYLFHQPHSAGP